MMDSLTVDDLKFELRRSSRRKSVQITVDRGGELVLSAPDACPVRKMEDFVRAKRFWIYTKLAEKEALRSEAPAKQYVNGEGFPYLGLYFHWRSILLPPRIVEYIIVHELVHLRQPHHTPEFWTRLERAMPDFAVRKQWLAERGTDAWAP